MANLDVSVTLRLINQMSGPAKAAASELARVKTAAKGLEGASGAKLAGDLSRVAAAGGKAGAEMRAAGTATASLGGQLDRAAAAGGKVTTSVSGAKTAIQGAEGAATALGSSLDRSAAAGGRTATAGAKVGVEMRAAGTATASLGGQLDRAAAAGGRTAAAGGKIGIEMRTAGAATASFGQQLNRAATAGGKVTTSVAGARTAIQGADGAAKALGSDFDRSATASGRIAPNVAGARAAIQGADTAARALAADLERAAAAAGRIRVPVSARSRGGDRTAVPASAVRDDRSATPAKDGGSAIYALGRNAALAAGGAMLVRQAARSTIGEAITFEKAWADVLKKVNDAPNSKAMQDLQLSVRQMAIDLGIPRERMAALVAEAGAAGTKFQELERMARLAAKGSVGWDMTPEDAAQKLSYIRAAMGLTMGETEKLADKMNALGDNSPAKEREIVEMFLRSGAAAKAAGVDTDTSLAFLTAIRSTGMQEEITARFWSAFTGKLATAGAGGRGSKELAEGLKILGLTTEQVAAGMKKDAGGTILDVFDRLNKAAEPAKAALKIGGGEWWDEMMRAAQATPEIVKQLDFVKKSHTGSLDQSLNIQLGTTAKHLERLKELSKEVGDQLGRWALPGINAQIKSLIDLKADYDRRATLRDAAKPEPPTNKDGEPQADFNEDPFGWAGQKARQGTRWLKDKSLDLYAGSRPTLDPSRAAGADLLKEAADLAEVAETKRKEASALDARSQNAAGQLRKDLAAKAEAARAEAAVSDRDASLRRRVAGPHTARDMTDVEVGEAAARALLAAKWKREATEAAKPAFAPAPVSRPIGEQGDVQGEIVFDPDSGRYRRVPRVTKAEAEPPADLADQRGPSGRFGLTGPRAPEGGLTRSGGAAGAGTSPIARDMPPADRARFGLKGPSAPDAALSRAGGPAGAAAFPLSLDISKPMSDLAKLKAGFTMDFTTAAAASMSGYNATLAAGLATATSATIAAGAQMRAALSFTATPTISPSYGAAPAGGAAPASGGATAAPRAARAPGGGSGGATIQQAHFYGVNDPARLHRELAGYADRAARDERDNALHDVA